MQENDDKIIGEPKEPQVYSDTYSTQNTEYCINKYHDFLLQEDGSYLLQETGDKIIIDGTVLTGWSDKYGVQGTTYTETYYPRK